MELIDFYSLINGDYDEVISRLLTEERVKKYLFKFLDNTDFEGMCQATENNDWNMLFMTTHNLKGMGKNLGLGELAKVSSDACELVRNGQPDCDITPFVEKVKEEYEKTISAINKLER